MNAETDELLRAFAAKLTGAFLAADYADVQVSAPAGSITATYRGAPLMLHLPGEECLDLLDQMQADSSALWGEGVDPVEAAARLLLVHLDESLATYVGKPPQWWTYRSGAFLPVPPWEAHRLRHQ